MTKLTIRLVGALLLGAVLCPTTRSAEGADLSDARKAGQDSSPQVKIIPDVVYGHKAGMALTFDVIKPRKPTGSAVLFMVSGGWFSKWSPPDKAFEESVRDGSVYSRLVDSGHTLFLVRHGSAPQFKVPEAVADVRRAVRFIRLHAGEYGIDAARLGVFGGSAGGHLSLMLGTASDEGKADANDPVERISDRVAAVVAYFPPTDLRNIVGPSRRFPALEFDPALAESVSPFLHVTRDDAPTLLVHGDRDTLVKLKQSEQVHEAFQKAGVTSELIVLEGAGHGFKGDDTVRATKALVAWFDKHLAKQNP